MSHHAVDLLRKYAEIINEAQQPQQLDEGITDTLKPVAQKLGKWLMSKIDPETAKQLKQAYDQAGGDKDKFMAAIGITKDDVAKIAPEPPKDSQQAPAQQPQMNEWLSIGDRDDDPLKVKVLNLLMNGIPLAGFLSAIGTLAIGGVTAPVSWPIAVWWVISFALAWGVGHYDMGDVFPNRGKPEGKGKAALDTDLAIIKKQFDAAQNSARVGDVRAWHAGNEKMEQLKQQYQQLKAKYNKDPDSYTRSVNDPNAPTPASQINPVNRNPVAPKQQTDINGNPI